MHVSENRRSAAPFRALVPLEIDRITALDNRVVVVVVVVEEGETGPGPGAGAGPGEAPWLPKARSPKTCPIFSYSPF